MASKFVFPIQLFQEISNSSATWQRRSQQNLAALIVQTTKNDHWSAFLIRQKLRYQIKTLDILRKAVQRKDNSAIERWYIPGLYKESGFFSSTELDILEQMASNKTYISINPLLDLERGLVE